MTGTEVSAAPGRETARAEAEQREAEQREAERLQEWERHLAPLRNPPPRCSGLPGEDAQTWRDIRFRVERLLEYGDVLPAGLTALLDDYLRELGDPASGRWRGIGAVSEYEWLADHIGDALTDGEWPPGSRVHMDGCSPPWYLYMASSQSLGRAMQALAARGEVTIGDDGYYARAPR